MKKRIICFILTLVMLLSLLPAGALAAAPYYEKAAALEARGTYVLAIRDESTVRGGTLFTFTQDGTVEGSWSIKGGPGYLVATRSALNCNSASVTAQASWNITVADGAVTMQNNTSSKYYLLFSGGAFTINRNAGDPIALYDADGNKLTALPESPFQAYICDPEGAKFLSDAITADDAEKSIVTDYVITDALALKEFGLYGIHTRDVGGASAWQLRDGKLFAGETGGLNAALDPAKAPDAADYADGKLQIGGGYLTVKDGALAIGTKEEAAAVTLWKKLDAPASEGTYLAITCDIHHKFRSDFAVDSETGQVIGTTESAERLDRWLTKASADFGNVYFDQLISCGDMGDANTAITGANYWDRVVVGMDTVANHEKVLGGGFFINGNHEWANGQYASLKDTNPVAKRVREAGYVEESDDYVIYSLSAAQTNNSFNAADITALDNYLKTAPNKPIFIASHFPLHNFNRTEQRRDDLINVLNSYADRLQIIFLWGHNHTEEDPNYGIVFDGHNIDDSGMDIPHIEFTYCAAGCMTDDEYDVHAVFTKPKGMIAYIAPDKTVSLTYYDVNYNQMSTTVLPKPGAAEPEVDKTYLSELIERADSEAVKAAQDGFPSYKEEDYNALIKALTAAQAVQADEDADQASVDEAAAALENAYSDYMEIPFMYPTYFLEEAVAAAGKIDKSKYSEDFVKALEMAVASAEAVIAKAKDEDVAWSEIESAEKAIYDAIDALIPLIDTSHLEDVITQAEADDPTRFTEESYKALADAIAAAKEILKDPKSQAEIDAAIEAILNAVKALELNIRPDVDKTELKALIEASKSYPKALYTPESYAKMLNAVTQAIETDFDEGATQECVDAAVKTVKDAIAALEPVDRFLFDDVKNEKSFYFNPVYWAYEAKPQITNGVDKTHFGPDQGCTRGQVVTFLWRAAGEPAPANAETAFTDVGPKAFYAKAVAWAVEKGITKGMTDTTFAPNDTCTRGQIVTFLYRFKDSPAPKSTETAFTDVSPKAFYAKAVAWAVENGVTKGMTDTTFAPNDTCTRGQVVTFLFRATAE